MQSPPRMLNFLQCNTALHYSGQLLFETKSPDLEHIAIDMLGNK